VAQFQSVSGSRHPEFLTLYYIHTTAVFESINCVHQVDTPFLAKFCADSALIFEFVTYIV